MGIKPSSYFSPVDTDATVALRSVDYVQTDRDGAWAAIRVDYHVGSEARSVLWRYHEEGVRDVDFVRLKLELEWLDR